jgi:hypothetical protein
MFYIEIGKGPKGSYHGGSYKGLTQAVWQYVSINTHGPYKKRLTYRQGETQITLARYGEGVSLVNCEFDGSLLRIWQQGNPHYTYSTVKKDQTLEFHGQEYGGIK